MCGAPLRAQSDPANAAAPRIELRTAERAVFAGDSIVIDVEAVGLLGPLDTTALYLDADLLRETVGTRIAVIGGRVVEVRTRRMEFLPRTEDTARFGPVRGESERGEVRSNVLRVDVLPPADDDWSPGPEDHRIALRVSNDTPWVREAVTIDLVLEHRFAIADERVTLPRLGGLDVLPVYTERRTVAPDDGATNDDAAPPWRRVAWRWLAWPTRSGPIEIGSARWSGTMVRSRASRGQIDATAAPLQLDVRAAATRDDASGWWLPARALTLSDRWSSDPRQIAAGDEIVRTLVIEAQDVLAAQLPAVVPLESRSFTSVPLGVTREQSLINGTLHARAEHGYRMTARSPVPVFLDTVRVAWWDTERDAAAEAIVPARRIDIGVPARGDLVAAATDRLGLASRVNLLLASVPLPRVAGLASAALLTAALLLVLLASPIRRAIARRRGRPPPRARGEIELPPI